MKFARTIAAGFALASLAVAGAAQAEVRSGSAMPSTTPAAATSTLSRGSASATDENEIAGPAILIAILAISAIIAAIAVAASGNDSPG